MRTTGDNYAKLCTLVQPWLVMSGLNTQVSYMQMRKMRRLQLCATAILSVPLRVRSHSGACTALSPVETNDTDFVTRRSSYGNQNGADKASVGNRAVYPKSGCS